MWHRYVVILWRLRLWWSPLFHVLLPTTRYRCRVAYDGTRFQGFQIQQGSKRRTVQGELEQVLSQRLNEPIRVVGAGRTDAGVHSRGQAVHFDCFQDLSPTELSQVQQSIEKMIPKDMAVWHLQRAPPPVTKTINGKSKFVEWNVMFDSTHKLYSYRLNVAPAMNPIERYHRWHPDRVERWFDYKKFNRLLQYYVGSHDFKAFATGLDALERRLGGPVNTVRTVYRIDVVREDESENDSGNIRINILLKGALYKQVRNLVGTALRVCEGKLDETMFRKLIENETGHYTREDNPAKPAPPEGLTLEHVYFSDGDMF